MRDLMAQFDYEGFTVRFYAEPELDSPDGHFASGDAEADAETIRKIECGDYLWFQVACEASKNGVLLGRDYLGGCCYATYDDFMSDGYASDMRDEAISDAKATLAKLCAA